MANHDSSNIRMLEYKNVLKKLKGLGFHRVYSSNLADTLGISSSLVRKDFCVLSTHGNKRGGYIIEELLTEINRILHKDVTTKAIIAGVGKLGTALCDYTGFKEENMEISAAFDVATNKLDESASIPVYHLDKMVDYIMENNIKIGILTVPAHEVQKVADNMAIGGIKGFLNFAPLRLVLPSGCYENHVNLAMELEKIVFRVLNNVEKIL